MGMKQARQRQLQDISGIILLVRLFLHLFQIPNLLLLQNVYGDEAGTDGLNA
jgi:hypothetical protein